MSAEAAAAAAEGEGTLTTPPAGGATPPEGGEKKTETPPEGGDGKGSDGTNGGEAEAGKTAAEVPDSYQFTAPEGRELDTELMDEVTPIFKEAGLSQEAAQKVVDMHFRVEQRNAEMLAKMASDWVSEVKKDPDVGGEKFEASTRKVQAIVQKYAGDDLPVLQEILGPKGFNIGNHPALFRTFHRIATALGEDTAGAPRSPTAGEKTPAEIFYGKVDGNTPDKE